MVIITNDWIRDGLLAIYLNVRGDLASKSIWASLKYSEHWRLASFLAMIGILTEMLGVTYFCIMNI